MAHDSYEFPSGEKIFFTSDTHFCHKSILSFADRPFSSIEEMDKALIENWNSVVPEDGIVFHLGDFCFGGITQWKTIRKKLNGKIYLILGNHDFNKFPQSCLDMFEMVTQQMHIYIEGKEIYLNHNPFLAFGGAYRKTWALFGHVHTGPRSCSGQDMPRMRHLFNTQYDVGVDNNNYKPVSFYEVRDIIAGRKFKGKSNPNQKLYDAVCEFNPRKVNKAIADGANVNVADFHNRTSIANAIVFAVEVTTSMHNDDVIRRAREVIAILLRHGASPVLNPNGVPGVIEGMIRRVMVAEPWDATEAVFYFDILTLLRMFGIEGFLEKMAEAAAKDEMPIIQNDGYNDKNQA